MDKGMEFEGSFKNKDAQNLIYRAFIPEGPRASVILVHGLGEHSLKYGYFPKRFYEGGIAVFLYDQRGQGRSDGQKGHVDRFEDYLDDLKQFTEIVKAETLCEDVYLVGLSLGGLISLLFAIDHGEEIRGVVVSAPALRLKNPPSGIEANLAVPMAGLFPRLTVPNRIPFAHLTHDMAMISETKADRLSLRMLSFKLFAEMTKAMKCAFDNASKIDIPALLLHGTEDKVIDVEAAKEFYEKMKSSDKEIKLYDGLYHELFRETRREEILGYTFDWISKRAGKR